MTIRPVLLVTGGSRGIGAATARLAAERGFDVAINYQRDAEAAGRVAEACRAAGARAEIIQADVAREEEVTGLFQAVDERLGRLTHLVNNAGITGRGSRLDEASTETIRTCIDINVTGAILAAREAVKRMARRHGGSGGSIVNLSSTATNLGSPNEFVWYAASKGAIDSLTIGLAREWAADGIRTNAVAPGLIETDIHESSGLPDRLERLTGLVPLGRPGTPEEVAETILFLLSETSSYVNGIVLRVGGGR